MGRQHTPHNRCIIVVEWHTRLIDDDDMLEEEQSSHHVMWRHIKMRVLRTVLIYEVLCSSSILGFLKGRLKTIKTLLYISTAGLTSVHYVDTTTIVVVVGLGFEG